MMHRGRVAAVDAKGVYVRAGSLGQGVFLCGLVGAAPAVGASVLVADTGEPGYPDLTVIGGGLNADGSLTVKNGTSEVVRLWRNGPTAMIDSSFAGRPLRLYSGGTTLTLAYGGGATLSPQTQASDGAGQLVTKGYVDAIKSALAASTDFADFKARVAAL